MYGASAIDDDGTGLFTTGLGHGDAIHMSDMDPDRPGLEVFQPHESPSQYGPNALELRDARTGGLIFGVQGSGDIGRGLALDVDPRYRGYEMWGSGPTGGMYTAQLSTPNSVLGPRGVQISPDETVDQLRRLVGRRSAARAARRHDDLQVELARRQHHGAPRAAGRLVEQRHQGHAEPQRRHPRRLARGSDLARVVQRRAAHLHDDHSDDAPVLHADARSPVSRRRSPGSRPATTSRRTRASSSATAWPPPPAPNIVTSLRTLLGPPAPVFTAISEDTGRPPATSSRATRRLSLSGTATPGTTVTVTRFGVGPIGTAAVDAAGNWTLDYTGTALPEGVSTFVAAATDGTGTTGPLSARFGVTVDTTAPAPPIIETVAAEPGLVLRGTAEAGGAIDGDAGRQRHGRHRRGRRRGPVDPELRGAGAAARRPFLHRHGHRSSPATRARHRRRRPSTPRSPRRRFLPSRTTPAPRPTASPPTTRS